jgi:mannosyltransferase PIG-M
MACDPPAHTRTLSSWTESVFTKLDSPRHFLGALYGLAVHFKIYPLVYGPVIVLYLGRGYVQRRKRVCAVAFLDVLTHRCTLPVYFCSVLCYCVTHCLNQQKCHGAWHCAHNATHPTRCNANRRPLYLDKTKWVSSSWGQVGFGPLRLA